MKIYSLADKKKKWVLYTLGFSSHF
jgi:hypothetical protein